MSSIYFYIIPVVVVVVILKICLIFWRIWLYQKRREQRVYLVQNNRCRAQAQQPSARVVGVERSIGPEGFTQRTSYVVNQPGLPARQVTRTVVIRPNDNRRPNDPNLPPSYDHAVTGRDKSVKVDLNHDAPPTAPPPTGPLPPPPPPPPAGPPQASAPPLPHLPPPHTIAGIPPPEYTPQVNKAGSHDDNNNSSVDETRPLLP